MSFNTLHSIDWLELMSYLPNMVINESRDFKQSNHVIISKEGARRILRCLKISTSASKYASKCVICYGQTLINFIFH